MNKLIPRSCLSAFVLGLGTVALNFSNPSLAQNSDQPPVSGQCFIGNDQYVDCWEDVEWRRVPGDSGFPDTFVGLNTISRQGNAINYDFYDFEFGYTRYLGNCESQVIAMVKSEAFVAKPDEFFRASPFLAPALEFACSVEVD